MINFLRISNKIRLGNYLHLNGTIDDIASKDIIGVCVIPSNFLPDNKARFISMASMDPKNKEKGNYLEESRMVWYYNREEDSFHQDFMIQKTKLPLDRNFDGVIEGYDAFGYLPTLNSPNSNLTIANPQDPGTEYFNGTPNRIPSPYALDGSFNQILHYRGLENDDWALTDYRGDLNTRKVVYSIDPGEEYCPAFYCCEKFSPGYRDHEWYLPAIGELAFIPPRLKIIRNRMWEAINAGSPGIVLSINRCWSSSERDSMFAWYIYFDIGGVFGNFKNVNYYARAFLAI